MAKTDFNNINIDAIVITGDNPRAFVEDEAFKALVESIGVHGVLNPLLINIEKSEHILVAGERRLRAARKAGLTSVPCTIVHNDSANTAEKRMIENEVRSDLSAFARGLAIKSYMEQHPDMTQDDVAKKFYMERTRIPKAIKMTELPGAVWDLRQERKLSDGHTEALLPLLKKGTPEQIIAVATEAASNKLTVQETRQLVKETLNKKDASVLKKVAKLNADAKKVYGKSASVKLVGDKARLSFEAGIDDLAARLAKATVDIPQADADKVDTPQAETDGTDFIEPTETHPYKYLETYANMNIPEDKRIAVEYFNKVVKVWSNPPKGGSAESLSPAQAAEYAAEIHKARIEPYSIQHYTDRNSGEQTVLACYEFGNYRLDIEYGLPDDVESTYNQVLEKAIALYRNGAVLSEDKLDALLEAADLDNAVENRAVLVGETERDEETGEYYRTYVWKFLRYDLLIGYGYDANVTEDEPTDENPKDAGETPARTLRSFRVTRVMAGKKVLSEAEAVAVMEAVERKEATQGERRKYGGDWCASVEWGDKKYRVIFIDSINRTEEEREEDRRKNEELLASLSKGSQNAHVASENTGASLTPIKVADGVVEASDAPKSAEEIDAVFAALEGSLINDGRGMFKDLPTSDAVEAVAGAPDAPIELLEVRDSDGKPLTLRDITGFLIALRDNKKVICKFKKPREVDDGWIYSYTWNKQDYEVVAPDTRPIAELAGEMLESLNADGSKRYVSEVVLKYSNPNQG